MAGRPTKLTPAVVAKAREYDFAALRQVIPTIEGLALYLGVHRDTIYEWSSGDGPLNKQFSDITKQLMTVQGLELINGSLRNKLNPQMSRLILSSKHAYVEKSEVDNNVSGQVQFTNDVPRPRGGDAS